jgi:hypothetical protein
MTNKSSKLKRQKIYILICNCFVETIKTTSSPPTGVLWRASPPQAGGAGIETAFGGKSRNLRAIAFLNQISPPLHPQGQACPRESGESK